MLSLEKPFLTDAAQPSQVVSKVALTEKTMALTFDAGSDAGITLQILGILAKHKIKCTFFLTGEYAQLHPDLAQEISKQGHEIGNHSYSHPNFKQISVEEMKKEIVSTEHEIIKVIGKPPVLMFRPPFGDYDAVILQAVGEAGYSKTIMWTIDTIDWNGTPAETMIKKVVHNSQPGAIVLMHVGSDSLHTAEALPKIIEGLIRQCYKLTTVSDMLAMAETPGPKKTYTVMPGDTLWGIAFMLGVTVDALAAANEIVNPDSIYPGQVLIVPVTY
ncbi:hypothetical protein SPSIL_024410 [Sporomusa silvacetica DSM 10669]|uniref:Peptidoglycan-N-acetylglucosamine deacetylase n=1 Tax=Sporomusa silvacetica DSM 10669 TaxID=1123289 RepID=A0ABZ3IKU1_9FIRM|nr:polysaccharide deacetylase family protein [Sporomusa silvacetica]OZC13398.1 peptidoglycan-N-acetylglucosamine deacetylase [Sporomusa silvacetica DSM 10669]